MQCVLLGFFYNFLLEVLDGVFGRINEKEF